MHCPVCESTDIERQKLKGPLLNLGDSRPFLVSNVYYICNECGTTWENNREDHVRALNFNSDEMADDDGYPISAEDYLFEQD
ncbi:MAG: hypothetical protein EHM49_03315 [Deltaproteobacteria bacterium]|nr:MAG: hypothetical protein EHM49_03315 [Deltaproteobacteria bacterium]